MNDEVETKQLRGNLLRVVTSFFCLRVVGEQEVYLRAKIRKNRQVKSGDLLFER